MLAKYLPKSEYLRGIMTLVLSSASGQAFFVLLLPVMTRFYSPSAFGQFGLFTMFIVVTAALLSFRYEVAMVSCESDREVGALIVAISFLILLMFPVLIVCYRFFIHANIMGFGRLPDASLFPVALGMFAIAWLQVFRFLFLRDKHYGTLSKVNFTIYALRGCFITGLGLLNVKSGLLMGDALGRVTGPVYAMAVSRKRFLAYIKGVSLRSVLAAIKKHKHYPIYTVPSSLITALGATILIPLLAAHFTLVEVGYYTLAARILNVPISLISMNTADAFHGQIAAHAKTGDLKHVRKTFFLTARHLLYLCVPPGLLLMVAAPSLSRFIFGAAWGTVGMLMVVCVPWVCAQFVVLPLTRIVFVLGGQRIKFIYDLASLAVAISSFYVGIHYKLAFVSVIAVVSGCYVASYLIYFMVLCYILFSSVGKAMPEKTVEQGAFE